MLPLHLTSGTTSGTAHGTTPGTKSGTIVGTTYGLILHLAALVPQDHGAGQGGGQEEERKRN